MIWTDYFFPSSFISRATSVTYTMADESNINENNKRPLDNDSPAVEEDSGEYNRSGELTH